MNLNVYQLNTKDFSVIQITNFRTGLNSEKSEKSQSYLEKQQEELFQFVRDTKAENDWFAEKYKNNTSDLFLSNWERL